MNIKLIFFSALGLIVLVIVLYYLRNYKMATKYSIIWLLMGLLTFLTPLLYPFWSVWAEKLRLADPNLLVLVLGIIGTLLLCMQFSLELSRNYKERNILARKIALLNQRIEKLEKNQPGNTQ